MQNIQVRYVKEQKIWVARYHDSIGMLGHGMVGDTRDEAVFRLGAEVGRKPQEFTRKMAEYLTEKTA